MKPIVSLTLCLFGLVAFAAVAEEAKCPVSGKPVDPEISLNINGKPVGFCCDNCKAKVEKGLNVTDAGPAKCPISGKPADKKTRLLQTSTEAVYFCCGKCQKKYTESNGVAAVEDQGPGKCQYSGKNADPKAFVVFLGKKTYFCCEKCVAKYRQEHNVLMTDKGPDKCAVSGEPAEREYVAYRTKTDAVYFCCEKCAAKHVEDKIAAKL